MLAEERLAAIVAAVEQRGAATVAQLCEATGAGRAGSLHQVSAPH